MKELQQQLAEKDKEIEKLNLMIKTLPNHDTEIEQQIRKQVCDEIREKLNEIEKSITNNIFLANEIIKTQTKQKEVYKNIFKILDQIEQAKENIK